MLKHVFFIGWLLLSGTVPLLTSSEAPAAHVTIFAHGLGGDATQRHPYEPFIGPMIGENGPEWNETVYGHKAGRWQSCLGQDDDVKVIAKQIAEHTEKNIILAGVSKGAATIINTVGHLAEIRPDLLSNVSALILDAPFDRPETAAAHMVKSAAQRQRTGGSSLGSLLAWSMEISAASPRFESIARYAQTWLYRYNPAGITPIKAVLSQWPLITNKTMVIALVHSQDDEVISVDASRRLYVELQALGFKNTYLVEPARGWHANAFWGLDAAHVSLALQYIYQRHGLPLAVTSPRYAPATPLSIDEASFIKTIQPSAEEVLARMAPVTETSNTTKK